MRSIDEEIARRLQEAADAGELKMAPSFGKPFAEDSGWNETPEALRLPFKILKDSGTFPPEIEMFHERARLRAELANAADAQASQGLRAQLSELEQKIAFRLEALRRNASL